LERIVLHPRAGEVKITKRGVSSSIRIYVHLKRGVRVVIPVYVRYKDAISFLDSKIEWVERSLERQRKKEEIRRSKVAENGVIKTLAGQIFITKDSLGAEYSNLREPKIIFGERETHIIYSAMTPSASMDDAVIKAIKQLASGYLPNRMAALSEKSGLLFEKLSLKNNRSNWGSCSSKNNINLNIHLVRLPAHLCDYVIYHELCHLKFRNHGKDFHKLLNTLCDGREREYSRELRQYSPVISELK